MALNEARFYYVLVGPALLDRYAVIRVWGRIGGQQRIMVTPCQTADEARTLANRLIRRRLKRGYTLVQDKLGRKNGREWQAAHQIEDGFTG
ncbi:MAG: WGR domain-containing protein [Chloroflexota bacterium]